ncbi:MAG: hypothetical protein ACK4F7_09120 [Inhella sp.]
MLIAAALWVVCYWLNRCLLGFVALSETASWVFLPAAVRLLMVLLWRWQGALGLFLGTLLTNQTLVDLQWQQSLGVAAISSLAPWFAVLIGQRRYAIGSSLAGLTAAQLCAFAALSALISGGLHASCFAAIGISPELGSTVVAMAIGDFLGAMVVLYLLRFALRWPARGAR